ncbi:hypothetical protein N6H05_19355 [Sphingobium sp. WTD-1]|uniref:hypothetical protein n=1 Tax=Sphingobium sp. WTD-1 TaxID=2979467 RepID=UPI0024DE3468|nr:hypothetical protein [Sphingobium sp. WTD-1]WIA55167.1 hypothetical protein N6H05_19355 [Sphingobium sp. WTD-1]
MIEYKKTLSVKYDWRSFNANHIAQDIIMNKPNYMLRHAFGEKMLEECQCDYEVPVGLFWSPTVQRQTEHVPYEEVDAWINAQQPKRWKTNYRLSDPS